WQLDWSIGVMSEAKVGLAANVWVEVAGLFMVVLDFVNTFGFVPLHVLKPAMRINASINMLFGIAACYSRESAPAMPITSGSELFVNGVATLCITPNELFSLDIILSKISSSVLSVGPKNSPHDLFNSAAAIWLRALL